MNPLEEILNEFRTNISQRLLVEGIVLSGSYAHSEPLPASDVDIRVVVKSKEPIYERGVVNIRGKDISYFAAGHLKYAQLFNDQFVNQSKFEARIFAASKIIYEIGGFSELTRSLITRAGVIMETPFKPLKENEKVARLYALSNQFKKVKQMDVESRFFKYNYYSVLSHLLNCYSVLSGNEHILEDKLEEFFFSNPFREKHFMENLEDETFKQLFVNAILAVDKKELDTLFKHVMTTFNTINVKSFTIKSI